MFLYNDTLADNWRYVFNNDVFEKAFKIMQGKNHKKEKSETRKPRRSLHLGK